MATQTTCGHQPHCAKGLCRKCYNREYTIATAERRHARYQANREAIKASFAEYRSTRRAEARERTRKWREEHPGYRRPTPYRPTPEKAADLKAKAALWARENRDRKAAAAGRRRARESVGADLTAAQWKTTLALFDGHCAYCDRLGQSLVMEHMTPLARGGRHTAANVVPACADCNARKFIKTAEEFAGWTTPPRLAERAA